MIVAKNRFAIVHRSKVCRIMFWSHRTKPTRNTITAQPMTPGVSANWTVSRARWRLGRSIVTSRLQRFIATPTLLHKLTKMVKIFLIIAAVLILFTQIQVASAQAPNIGVNGYFATDKVQKGRAVQAAIVIDIPSGYHINSNRPLESFLIPTSLKVEASSGIRTGAVMYPRAALRKFKFSQKQLAVY